MTRTLRIHDAPAKRGRLIDASQIVEMIGGAPPKSEDWVHRNVPGKLAFGHRTKRWYSEEVHAWIESCREE